MSLLGKLSSFKKKQPVPSLSTSTDDLMVELEDGLKIDLSYPLNSDFREKYFELSITIYALLFLSLFIILFIFSL